jgi:sugar phosphate isomerase/epimerase
LAFDGKRILIPSVRVNELHRLSEFKRHFLDFELDVFGVKKKDHPGHASLAATIGSSGMHAYSVHLRGFNLSGKDSSVVGKAAAFAARLHSLLGSKLFVIHPGFGDLEHLAENSSELASRMPCGISLAVESMERESSVMFSLESIKEFLHLIRGSSGNLGICIDTTHPPFTDFNKPESYTGLLIGFLRNSHPRLKHLHLSDRAAPIGDDPGDHKKLGKGIIDWGRVRAYLEETGYPGRAAIELKWNGATEDYIDAIKVFSGGMPNTPVASAHARSSGGHYPESP